MQICTSPQTDNHAWIPPVSFLYRPDALPATLSTASKLWRHFYHMLVILKSFIAIQLFIVTDWPIMCWYAMKRLQLTVAWLMWVTLYIVFYCILVQILFCLHVQPVSNPDFVIPVEIDGTIHQVCLYFILPLHNDYICAVFTDRMSMGGNAVVSICPLVCFHSIFRTNWPMTLTFCMCIGDDHSCPGQRSTQPSTLTLTPTNPLTPTLNPTPMQSVWPWSQLRTNFYYVSEVRQGNGSPLS